MFPVISQFTMVPPSAAPPPGVPDATYTVVPLKVEFIIEEITYVVVEIDDS